MVGDFVSLAVTPEPKRLAIFILAMALLIHRRRNARGMIQP